MILIQPPLTKCIRIPQTTKFLVIGTKTFMRVMEGRKLFRINTIPICEVIILTKISKQYKLRMCLRRRMPTSY